MREFRNKVAAITGAASGIGRELAIELAKRGCHLALADVNEEGLAETATLVAAHGVRLTTIRLDVADRDAVFAWADAVVRDHGKVNLIFNNAGVAVSSTIESVGYEDFEWLMDINFWGVVHGTKAFLPHLRASGEGHIVNISSLFGLLAAPANGCYNAAKFAVRGFSECLRQELELMDAPVSLSCVHPGAVKTNISRSARVSEELAALRPNEETAPSSQSKIDELTITSANRAARIILRGVERNRRRILVGPDAHLLDLLVRLLPSAYQRLMIGFTRRLLKRRNGSAGKPQPLPGG